MQTYFILIADLAMMCAVVIFKFCSFLRRRYPYKMKTLVLEIETGQDV